MKLIYRGVSYDCDPPGVETSPGKRSGKYRGQVWNPRQVDFSHCGLCRHYQLTGRRGGTCQLMCVSVRGDWKPCSLGVPHFAADS